MFIFLFYFIWRFYILLKLKAANQPGNVYTYPSKKWYKHRRLELDSNDINYLFPRHHFQTMNQQSENGTNGVNSYHSNLNGNLLNENSNSMDSFHYNTSSSNHTYTSQMLKQASNSTDDYGIGNSNDEWSHNHSHSHNQQQSSHMLMHEDSFENFDANNDDDSGGDPDDDDPSFKKKKVKKTKTGRKKLSELGPDDKPYSCESKDCLFVLFLNERKLTNLIFLIMFQNVALNIKQDRVWIITYKRRTITVCYFLFC